MADETAPSRPRQSTVALTADATGGALEQPDAGAEPVVMGSDGLAEVDPEQAESGALPPLRPRSREGGGRPIPTE
jgi:hypothetical protein